MDLQDNNENVLHIHIPNSANRIDIIRIKLEIYPQGMFLQYFVIIVFLSFLLCVWISLRMCDGYTITVLSLIVIWLDENRWHGLKPASYGGRRNRDKPETRPEVYEQSITVKREQPRTQIKMTSRAPEVWTSPCSHVWSTWRQHKRYCRKLDYASRYI